jgi:hypothetical protein
MKSPLENAEHDLEKAWRACRPKSYARAEQLFHYTKKENLLSILRTRALWLSNVSTLKDTSELLYGRDIIKEVLLSRRPAQNSCLNLNGVVEKPQFFESVRSCSYVACFCLKGNLRSQWIRYGAKGSGCALGFNRQILEEHFQKHPLLISDPMPMIYDRRRLERAVACFLSKAEAVATRFRLKGSDCEKFSDYFMFRSFLYALGMKKPCCSNELEWRILQVSRAQKEPHLELSDIPPKVFATVTLGYKVDSKYEAELIDILKCNQLEHVKVRRSKVSLRALS